MKKLDADSLASLDIGRLIPVGANKFHLELGGYLSDDDRYLGIVILDKIDQDYSFVIQEKKSSGWECVVAKTNLMSEQEARKFLLIAMDKRGCK